LTARVKLRRNQKGKRRTWMEAQGEWLVRDERGEWDTGSGTHREGRKQVDKGETRTCLGSVVENVNLVKCTQQSTVDVDDTEMRGE